MFNYIVERVQLILKNVQEWYLNFIIYKMGEMNEN